MILKECAADECHERIRATSHDLCYKHDSSSAGWLSAMFGMLFGITVALAIIFVLGHAIPSYDTKTMQLCWMVDAALPFESQEIDVRRCVETVAPSNAKGGKQ